MLADRLRIDPLHFDAGVIGAMLRTFPDSSIEDFERLIDRVGTGGSDPLTGPTGDRERAARGRVERAGHPERVGADRDRDVTIVERSVGANPYAMAFQRADPCARASEIGLERDQIAGLTICLGGGRIDEVEGGVRLGQLETDTLRAGVGRGRRQRRQYDLGHQQGCSAEEE